MSVVIKQHLSKDSTRNFSVSDELYPFSIIHDKETIVEIPATSGTRTQNDAYQETETGAQSYDGGVISINGDITMHQYLDNLNPETATLDDEGRITKITDGIVGTLGNVGPFTRYFEFDVTSYIPSISITSSIFLSGSLGKEINNQVDNALEGKNFTDNAPIYDSQDHTNRIFIRNTNCWANIADLTCISPSNSFSNQFRAGTLITPRHLLVSAHYIPIFPDGTNIYFITQDGNNTTVELTVVGRSATMATGDFVILTLNEDAPSSITPCKIFPKNWNDYIVEYQDTRTPGLLLDQFDNATTADVFDFRNISKFIIFRIPENGSQRELFYCPKITGDSGNPGFFIIDTGAGVELVLLTTWTGGNAGSGPSYNFHIDVLNELIIESDADAGVSTGYTITEADLSGFNTY